MRSEAIEVTRYTAYDCVARQHNEGQVVALERLTDADMPEMDVEYSSFNYTRTGSP